MSMSMDLVNLINQKSDEQKDNQVLRSGSLVD